MARHIAALQEDRTEVKNLLTALDKVRARRDEHIRDAIHAGATWHDAATAAGISSVQVGKIVRKRTEDPVPAADGRRAAL